MKTMDFSDSGISGRISMNFMEHCGPGPIIVCSDDDLGLTLTYFTNRLNFAT